MDTRTVGVLGGGQIGRMLVAAGNRLGIRIAILDPGENVTQPSLYQVLTLSLLDGSLSPAGQVSSLCIEGSLQDPSKIKELASISDILTVEVEHVNTDMLEQLQEAGYHVRPDPNTIRLLQDKFTQKMHLAKNDIIVTDFMATTSVQEAFDAGMKFGYPFLLKTRRFAFEGRGNVLVKSPDQLRDAFDHLGGYDLYAEKFVSVVKELAVMVIRTKDDVICYPIVETVHRDNVCALVTAPAHLSTIAEANASRVARVAIDSFKGVGVYEVEMFLLADDSVLLNEVVPRPHNSGHYTIEGCEIDQFEAHLRAILDLPIPTPKMRVGAAMMINVVGESNNLVDSKRLLSRALEVPGANIHWYGKVDCRPGRKLAHVTITADNMHELKLRIDKLGIPESQHGLLVRGPRVAVIMCSEADLPTMKEAAEVLNTFEVSFEMAFVSAHRTPTRMFSYAQSAVERGVQVIIASAGGAAHLPGMVAGLTSIPVIGVPMRTAVFNGTDSLMSIVQMPTGVPVATVAIGDAANAALLAVRILAAHDHSLLKKMDNYLNTNEERVLRASAKLESVGYQAYLDSK